MFVTTERRVKKMKKMKQLKKMKRIILSLMVLSLIFSLSAGGGTAIAKSRPTSGKWKGFRWKYDKKTATLTVEGKGKMPYAGCSMDGKYVWPGWLDFDKAKKLVLKGGMKNVGEEAFAEFTELREIKMCDSIEVIETSAFRRTDNLEKMNMPASLKRIDSWAFYDSGMFSSGTLKLKFPKGLKSIGYAAFGSCDSIEKLIIPDSVKKIGGEAFTGCDNLRSVTISKNLKIIPYNAFGGCLKLKSITIRSKKLKKIKKVAFEDIHPKARFRVPKGKKKAYEKLLRKSGYKVKKGTVVEIG